jgi:Tfp pilus assembly protein PilN
MYVTLNISSTSIRLLSVTGRQVTRWGDAPLAPGLVRDGLVLQPPVVGEAIDTLFREAKIPNKRVITCLSGLPFTYRFFNLPRLKPALQEEAVLRAAKKEIPLPLEELYLSWQPVTTRQNEQDFFVVGVARNLVDALVRALAVASVEPYLTDLKPLALARAANRGEAIIASLEPDCFDIVLVVKGVPVIMYTASPRWEGATPEENTRQLVDELLKTVDFYNGNHPQEPISASTPLLLTGELSSEAATAGLIQNESGYVVEPLTPQLHFPAELPVASYTVNIGLALKKTPPRPTAKEGVAGFHDINVDVLSRKSPEGNPQPVSMKRVLSLFALVLVVALMLPAYQLRSGTRVETTRLQTELIQVDQEIYQMELTVKRAEQMEIAIRETTAGATAIATEQENILAHKGEFTSDLRLVTEALPPQTYFTYINIGKERLEVQGETGTLADVINYALALEAQERFSEVRIMEIDETATEVEQETGMASPEEESTMITFGIALEK